MRHKRLLCPHGRLHPSTVPRLKLLTRATYRGLLEDGGVPMPDCHLSGEDYRCDVCMAEVIGQR
ncbi:unnamed protein product [Choristocarpus tenellus]